MPVVLPLTAVPASVLRASNPLPFLGSSIFYRTNFLAVLFELPELTTGPDKPRNRTKEAAGLGAEASLLDTRVASIRPGCRGVSLPKASFVCDTGRGFTTLLRAPRELLLPSPPFAALPSVLEKCGEN